MTDMNTLKKSLEDWQEVEVALGSLAECLGLKASPSDHPKGLYWTDNPLITTLYEVLEALVREGILEKNAEDEYRWNRAFPSSLEQYYQSDWKTHRQSPDKT